ncbi:hypothetical protein LJC24_05550 [Desulfococcaceae bacterium OttesenSCG-928-F15]|nr:hypothetical protein [Desulfococcaceae bacterium OttesenSCG-928-F15]
MIEPMAGSLCPGKGSLHGAAAKSISPPILEGQQKFMSEAVSLKGVSDGLRLRIDRPLSQDQIQAEVIQVFERIRSIVVGAKITVDAGGQEGWILPFLKTFLTTEYLVSDVVPADPGSVQSLESRANQQENSGNSSGGASGDTLMVCGRIRSGQHIQHKGHILLMGDLNPGGEITAGGDIIVMGGLYGSVFAGHPGKSESMIVALDLRPTSIHIAGQIYAGQPKAAKGVPQYARLQDGKIVVELYLDNPPYAKLPWPEIR